MKQEKNTDCVTIYSVTINTKKILKNRSNGSIIETHYKKRGNLLNKEDVIKNKNEAIKMMTDYLDNCLAIDDNSNIKKVNLISYWQKDYINYIKDENNFKPINLKTYERGDIIKVNLGFNIGSELGGLHYCVVIDKKNNRNSPVVTVIPLSSQKTDKINKNSIMLGNDIYNKLVKKSNKLLEDSKIEIEDNKNQLLIETKKLTENNATSDEIYLKTTKLNNNITEAYKKLELAEKINKEVQKMKYGSIAIINQIRVISKQRIYDPKTEFDILSGIKLSNENLNLIDEKMKKIFIKN